MTNDRSQSRKGLRPVFCARRAILCPWITGRQIGGDTVTVYLDTAFAVNGSVNYLLLLSAAYLAARRCGADGFAGGGARRTLRGGVLRARARLPAHRRDEGRPARRHGPHGFRRAAADRPARPFSSPRSAPRSLGPRCWPRSSSASPRCCFQAACSIRSARGPFCSSPRSAADSVT